MSALMFLKDQLSVIALLVMILLVLAVLALVVRVATRAEGDERQPRRLIPRLRSDTLRSSFRQAVELIEANLAGRAQRYGLPWVLVLDEGDGHDALPLAQSGIASALGTDASASAATPGLEWNFFDKGVVIAVQGSYLGGGEEESGRAEQPWDEFLGLCRDYRPERPFDALVLTIPAALLINPHPDARLELLRLAKRANRRLWLAQNRFAMRFGLYLCISGAEHIPGFAAFARALPSAQRASMLGWSSPYDLNTSYHAAWVDEALAQTCRTLVDVAAELYAVAPGPDIATDYFLLPSRLQGLQSQLQLYVDELMRPSSYHEPFILRGIYFCGEASEAASQLANAATAELHAQQRKEPMRIDSGQLDDAPGLILPDTLRQPAFLRDLFEQKIFAEIGLTRPSGTQHLGQPLLARSLRWTAWGVAICWGLGLVVGEVILQRQVDALQQTLAVVERDTQLALRATERGEKLPSNWHRERTLALLQLMEQADRNRLWSVFMPGSWPLFDDLPRRIRERLEHSFGEIAVRALRQGLYERAAQLTGVSQNSATGELITGAPCSAPEPSGEPNAVQTLTLEELPEFKQLLGFLGAAEQIDQATLALQRLLDPTIKAEGRDLALLVRVVLGADLPDRLDNVAELFHSGAARSGGLNTGSMKQALQCSLQLRLAALDRQAFEDNRLLTIQRNLNRRIDQLAELDGEPSRSGPQAWQELLDTLKEQDTLLAGGGGAWIRQPKLQPGAAWEQALSHIGSIRLLNPDASQRARADSEAAFLRLGAELSEETGPKQPLRVSWDAKENRWTTTPEARNLREALQTLLAQPWMNLKRARPLGHPSTQAVISWDLRRLDQALAVTELRKRVQAEQLPRFPSRLQPAAEALVDRQLATQITEHLASGLIAGGRAMDNDAATLDAERSRLNRVQALLTDLGAHTDAEELRSLLQRDASARLRQLDDALNRAELYATQRRGFGAWQGKKGPVLAAYAMPDTAALAGYLEQQRNRIEALGKSAELLLQGHNGASQTAERWGGIVRDLERYRLKNPNSSLLALENFLLAMGGEVDAGNCSEQLARLALPTRGADFFASRHQQLGVALQQRCQELRGQKQRQSWRQFAAQFNRVAAGRPPFAPTPWRANAPALERDELQSLLQGWDATARSLRDLGINAQQPTAASRNFHDQFARSRDFLAPLLATEDGSVPGYDLAVEFRVNTGAESEGNKIIDWRLASGPQQVGSNEAAKPLHWEPGLPLTLTLRLAKDGPAIPRSDSRQPALRVEDRSVTLRYADPWALMSLLATQRVADPAARADDRSQLLKVEFPLLLVSAARGQDWGESRARVYLRLRISQAGKRSPLAWPGPFPTRAPEMP